MFFAEVSLHTPPTSNGLQFNQMIQAGGRFSSLVFIYVDFESGFAVNSWI